MFCTKCGMRCDDGAKFCASCGAPLKTRRDDGRSADTAADAEPVGAASPSEAEDTAKADSVDGAPAAGSAPRKRPPRIIAMAAALVACCIGGCVLALGGVASNIEVDPGSQASAVSGGENARLSDDAVREKVEAQFGIASDRLDGTWECETSREMGSASLEGTTFTFDDDAQLGAVWWGTYQADGEDRILCVYLADTEQQGFGLYASTATYDESFYHEYQLATPQSHSRWYMGLDGTTFTFAELNDDSGGFYDGKFWVARDQSGDSWSNRSENYSETIRVMDLEEGFVNNLTISRTMKPADDGRWGTLDCNINAGDECYLYSGGYDSVTIDKDSVTGFATEQEFCDKANGLLEQEGVDWLALARTSWDTRWWRLGVDEGGLSDVLAKVDVTCANGEQLDDLHTGGTCTVVMDEKEPEAPELGDEGPDDPVTYLDSGTESDSESSAPSQASAVPDALPAGVDAGNLCQISAVSLNAYWYSPDFSYVCLLNDDGTRGDLYHYFSYYRLSGAGSVQHGSIKSGSAYSIVLNANQDDEQDYELFAVGIDQLKSDDLTLVRADLSIDSMIRGTWKSGDTTLSFDADGTYEYDGDSWYWGYFFLTDATHIALGKESSDVHLCDMTLDGNTLTIDGLGTFERA